jgi:hypothetical protein
MKGEKLNNIFGFIVQLIPRCLSEEIRADKPGNEGTNRGNCLLCYIDFESFRYLQLRKLLQLKVEITISCRSCAATLLFKG